MQINFDRNSPHWATLALTGRAGDVFIGMRAGIARSWSKIEKKVTKFSFHTCTSCGRQERGDEKHEQQAGRPRAAFAGRTNHRHRQKCTNNPLGRIKRRAHHRARDDQQINSLSWKNLTLTKNPIFRGWRRARVQLPTWHKGAESGAGGARSEGGQSAWDPDYRLSRPQRLQHLWRPTSTRNPVVLRLRSRRTQPRIFHLPARQRPRAKENFTYSFAKWFYSWI